MCVRQQGTEGLWVVTERCQHTVEQGSFSVSGNTFRVGQGRPDLQVHCGVFPINPLRRGSQSGTGEEEEEEEFKKKKGFQDSCVKSLVQRSTTWRHYLCSDVRASDQTRLQRPTRGVPSDGIMGCLCVEENGRSVCEITSIVPRMCSPLPVFNHALANCTFWQLGSCNRASSWSNGLVLPVRVQLECRVFPLRWGTFFYKHIHMQTSVGDPRGAGSGAASCRPSLEVSPSGRLLKSSRARRTLV